MVLVFFFFFCLFPFSFIPGHPKECFLEVFGYLKPTKKHSFGCLGLFKKKIFSKYVFDLFFLLKLIFLTAF